MRAVRGLKEKTAARWVICAVLLAVGSVFAGCGVDDPNTAAQDGVVATKPVGTFAFGDAQTFAIASDVAVIQDPNDPGAQAVTLSADTQDAIMSTIISNMQERGFTQVTTPAQGSPDVFIQPSVMATTTTTVYYDYWYPTWGAYYEPWYGTTYSAGWSGVPDAEVVSTEFGTLVIDMTDPNNPDVQAQQIPSVWVGVVAGVLDSATTAALNPEIENGINQAFAQSPYIARSSDAQ